ncbi:MAG: glycosyltransferase [Acidimicrobiia bacterium]|nr:glycosyltransferase [Acidimicrobiia bacterium]
MTARWDAFPVSGRGLDGDDPGPPLTATRTAELSVERRTIVLRDHLTFERPPTAVSLAIGEVADRPLHVEWSTENDHQATTVTVGGLSEWRSSWSAIAKVHQLDLEPATELRYTARATPLIRAASTAFGHHYHQSLYRPMKHRVAGRPTPVGWDATPDPGFRHLEVLHLHWPEWVAFDDLAAHRAIIADLQDHDIPIVWTAHNLTPHEKRADVYDPIYAAWAEVADGVIHHSAWGEQLLRARYEFRPDTRHEVIAHGHFGAMWERAGLPARAEAEQRLGLRPTGLRIGIVGAPRAEKRVQEVLDAVAASQRNDVEVVCWSLGRDEVVPDDGRIAIAERYRLVERNVYAARLAACDVLALVFDPDGEMLATGAAADAIGLGLPVLRSDWGYLVEHLGAAGIPVGHTTESIATAVDALDPQQLASARRAALARKTELEWSGLAERTADLFERVILHEP